jgi:hypothetical protein
VAIAKRELFSSRPKMFIQRFVHSLLRISFLMFIPVSLPVQADSDQLSARCGERDRNAVVCNVMADGILVATAATF